MKLGVHRHRQQSGVPDGEENLQVERIVGHPDGHTIVLPAQPAKTRRQNARTRRPLPISEMYAAAG
jgi:hypothetical protein